MTTILRKLGSRQQKTRKFLFDGILKKYEPPEITNAEMDDEDEMLMEPIQRTKRRQMSQESKKAGVLSIQINQLPFHS